MRKGPLAEARPTSRTVHGVVLDDDYAWLRDENWRDVMRDPSALKPDIRAQLEAENAHTEAALSGVEGLRETLFGELKGRIKQDDSSVPAPDGPYAYANRYRDGGQHPLLVRTPRGGGAETVLLDGDAMAEGKDYFRLASAEHSPDHTHLAYAVDEKGSEYFTVRFRHIESGEVLPDAITETAGGVVWSADGRSVFYTRLDENHRPSKVLRHDLGAEGEDTLVYEEPDAGFFVGVGATQSRDYIVIDSHDHETSEVRLIPADRTDEAPRLVAAREVGVEYEVDHHGDDLVILTNADDAEDFKIVTAPTDLTSRDNWRDLVPHEQGRLIVDHVALADHLVRLERADGLPRIIVRNWADGIEHAIDFAEEAYALGLSAGYEYETGTIRFTYSSPTTPARVYDYDLGTRERTLRKEQEIPSGHDPDAYVTRRQMALAEDGETVPVTILHAKDADLGPDTPCLLYGYGSYGITIPSGFNANALSLVDRGFVYAVAHIRGGKDKGHGWYMAGKRERKTNTFTDFIAAAEGLVHQGYTGDARIVAQGGSAGGMLMGAIANMRPDLFLGIIAEVPFVDVLNTMLDDTLPLTPPEWPEWGNPIESEDDFAAIRDYSPYDNVEAKAYPHILAVAGLTDPRVTYWEPAKWVARLRATKTDDNLLLLRTNMEAGHAGASGRFDRLKEVALNYAFALKISGKA